MPQKCYEGLFRTLKALKNKITILYLLTQFHITGLSSYTPWKQRETLAQVFSCELREIFKNTFFYRTPPVAASKAYFVMQGLGMRLG